MKNFKDKVALVTGASSGIGEAIAMALAQEGATVILTARDAERLEQVRKRIADAGGKAEVMIAEVTDEAQVNQMAAAVHAKYPALDILINNAGVVMGGLTWEVEPADWRRLHEINVMGVVHGIRAFVPRMIAANKGGHVVNMSSVSGLVGARAMATYTASKFAVTGLSESLRLELHRYKIGVSVICPGYVKTPIQSKVKLVGTLDSAQGRQRVARDFENAKLLPEDIAKATLKAIRHNTAVTGVGPEATMASVFKRWAPGILERILRG